MPNVLPSDGAGARPTPATLRAVRARVHVRASAVASAFVLLALAVLAASPLFTFRRLDAIRSASATTTVAADSDLAAVRILFAEEVVLRQLIREGDDPTAPRRYAALRAGEDSLIAHLARVAPTVGPGVAAGVAVLRARAAEWHAAGDAYVAARQPRDPALRLTDAPDAARVPPSLAAVRALSDSTLAAHARLAAAVQQADGAGHRLAAAAIRDQRYLSVWLGVLAAGAAVAVAGAARRERALVHALARAVDEEHRLRAEAEWRREELVRLGESKARLVRGFTHDVKNPLGAADGYLGLLEDGIPDAITAGQRRSVERARRSLHAALHLIGDLLEVSRAESGAVDVRPVPTDLAAVAREAADEYRAQAEAKGLALQVVEGAAGAPPGGVPNVPPDRAPARGDARVTTDPARVRQVLGNLVANAVKYTDRGAVAVRVCGARGGRVAVEVVDTGRGIAPEQQARLFEEFVRLDPDAAPGAGIGLAISRRLARALGGDVVVRSAPGRGSTFTLWLPADAEVRTT